MYFSHNPIYRKRYTVGTFKNVALYSGYLKRALLYFFQKMHCFRKDTPDPSFLIVIGFLKESHSAYAAKIIRNRFPLHLLVRCIFSICISTQKSIHRRHLKTIPQNKEKLHNRTTNFYKYWCKFHPFPFF